MYNRKISQIKTKNSMTISKNKVLRAFAQYLQTDSPFLEMDKENYQLLKHLHVLPKKFRATHGEKLFHSREYSRISKDKPFTESGIISCARIKNKTTWFHKSIQDSEHVLIPINITNEPVYCAVKIYEECCNLGLIEKGKGNVFKQIYKEDEQLILWSGTSMIPTEFPVIFFLKTYAK